MLEIHQIENTYREQEKENENTNEIIKNEITPNENDKISSMSDQSQTPKLPLIHNDYNKSSPPSRLSMASRNSFAESSTTSLILPKIEDRHLPK